MSTQAEIIITVALSAAFVAAAWLIYGALVTPVRLREGKITVLLEAEGDAGGLEAAAAGMQWLRDSGRAELEIMIVDCGLSESGRAVAERLASDAGGVSLCTENALSGELKLRRGGCGGKNA